MKIICYIPMLEGQSGEIREWLEQAGSRFGIIPVLLPPVEWNDDLTPWPSDPIFRKGKAFGGRAEAYLRELEGSTIPSMEAGLGIIPDERWFIGVSLAGLFGIWSAARSSLFTRIASISGSFWYPGFTEWFRNSPFYARSVYLSLGDKEAESRNPRLRSIATDTASVRANLEEKGIPTVFEWTEGTHFGPMLPRLEKALEALASVRSDRTEGASSERVDSWESMHRLILKMGLIPFFKNAIPGYSIEEHTPPAYWFTEENLGPWDWKINCVQSGDIAYGKFLWGGKAAFATVAVYRELMNWRRSLQKYRTTEPQQRVLDYMHAHGSISIAEIRKLMGIKKSAADALMARLQMQTRAVTGDIQRVYRASDLHYAGWQRSSFCSPEALFEDLDFPFPGYHKRTLRSSLSPEESLARLMETVRTAAGPVPEALLLKMLG